uniref:NLR family pyrin domain containing 6 n=1 Tax=Capra hircus TaxID=9925 RepID=A0A8C2RV93_CAPHI
MEPRAAAARELLLGALEDLSQEHLKRFRHKLRDQRVDGRNIPWGRLEGADTLDLVELLVRFYGPERALDVAQKTLQRADVRDVAARLKERRLQSECRVGLHLGLSRPGRFLRLPPKSIRVPRGPAACPGAPSPDAPFHTPPGPRDPPQLSLPGLGPSSPAQLSVSEYKKKYREHVLRQHAKVKERDARSVKISKRFTKLLIAEEPEAERARRSDTHTFNRLFGRDEEGERRLTVALQGPAGIGKTMAARKILYDWAAGKLYHSHVDFAFFLSCRELLERPGTCSLADLILDQCPDREAPVQQMLAQSERLLFILDGVDEMLAPEPAEAAPCRNPHEAASGARVLGSLLSKELLPAARLLVTRRGAAPGRLQARLCSPQCAEVCGFSDKDRKKYFYKFFQDEWKAEHAYRSVKENEMLFSLCFVPAVCWIVCTVLRQQLQRGQDLWRASKTTTSVYLLFVASVLRSAPAADGAQLQRELRKLCRLARDGVLGGRARFSEEDLERLQLCGAKVQTQFLSKKEMPGVLETEVTYQFIDQSFQEFLAALSYLLEDEGAPRAAAGGIEALLQGDPELRGHLKLTTRFLFGLLSTERMCEIERHFGCTASERVKQQVLRWVQDQGQGCPRAAPEGTEEILAPQGTEESEEEEGEELDSPLELLYCLYETQEDAFVHQALRGLPELVLERVHFSRMDLAVLSYCVRCCPAGQALRLVSCRLAAAQEKKKRSLMKRLQGSLGGSS